MVRDYDLLGSKEVLDEIQNGRTRELLLLLQDKPVPEVQDPMNLQGGLSNNYETDANGNYILSSGNTSTVSRDADDSTNSGFADESGLVINPNEELDELEAAVSSNTSGVTTAYLRESDESLLDSTSVSNGTATLSATVESGTNYWVTMDAGGSEYTQGKDDSPSFPYTGTTVDIVDGVNNGFTGVDPRNIISITGTSNAKNDGYVADQFPAPTTPPADFKAWNAIRAEDVTTGGSTSGNPVEFEILDSTDTVLNSSRIPKSEITDTAFKLRNREYQETASAGQTTFTIPTTGDGSHYGIPILSVVTVEQNGSVLDGAWEFDGNDTITLSSGASDGDTITVSYDFDVFDSTLQPRAYLNRESTDETSPSISHFRYEYVI